VIVDAAERLDAVIEVRKPVALVEEVRSGPSVGIGKSRRRPSQEHR